MTQDRNYNEVEHIEVFAGMVFTGVTIINGTPYAVLHAGVGSAARECLLTEEQVFSLGARLMSLGARLVVLGTEEQIRADQAQRVERAQLLRLVPDEYKPAAFRKGGPHVDR